MADYAGAARAIRDHLAANWTTTPICYQNPSGFESPVDPATGDPLPWVFIEVFSTHSELRGAGMPGDHVWETIGLIHVHVFVTVNSGIALAEQYAVAIGEIYRAAAMYQDGNGSIVRTGIDPAPRPDGGASDADDGNWFRMTMTCGFEFLFRG
jgi:hypothetical protein